ncbi:MAG: HesA/MoeB/ThiF family protein [Deltaproteobacteria bacterium]|nr:HesA/MoeB/ThiF family protein [Deltaproteobacteria bacterium]
MSARSDDETLRYSSQARLPELGAEGQEKLRRARVLCVGAGGLGAPVLLYLASAGVGRIGIIDPDTVSLSNLQRQVIYRTSDCGRLKAEVAREQLLALNPFIDISIYPTALGPRNALTILNAYNLIIDGTDNFATKFLLNDACARLSKPLIYASVTGFEGQVASFSGSHGPCFRCLYPQPPVAAIPNCAEAGVLGAMVGVVGSLQALQAVQCILRGYAVPETKLSFFDGRTHQLSNFRLAQRADCAVCSQPKDQIRLTSGVEAQTDDVLWLDVRSPDEWQSGHIAQALNWPVQELERGNFPELQKSRAIRVYCATGLRSQRAAARLKAAGFERVDALELGLRQWTGALVTDTSARPR